MLRGNKLVPQALRFKNYKLFMRSAYGLYIAVTLLGIWVYSVWYAGAAPAVAAGGQAQPVAQGQNQLTVPGHHQLRVQPARSCDCGRHDRNLGQPGWRAAHRHRRRRHAAQIQSAIEGPELQPHLRQGRRVPLLLRAAWLSRRRRYGRHNQGRSGWPGATTGRRRAANRRSHTPAHA